MLKTLYQIIKREIKLICGNFSLASITFLAPLLYGVLVCAVYSNHTLNEMPIAVAMLDNSKAARSLALMLDSSPKLHTVEMVSSSQEIRDLMIAGKINARVIIPADFSQNLKRGQGSSVTAFVNGSSMVPAIMATSAITTVVQTFSAGVSVNGLMKSGLSSEAAIAKALPVKLDMRTMFNPSYNYSNFMVPGLLTTILQQVALLAIALSWAGEVEDKRLPSLLSISKNSMALLIGKGLPYILINCCIAELYLRVFFPLNGIPIVGSYALTLLFSFLFVSAIVFWGMWFSALCKKKLLATQMLMFIALPSFILSGFTWPMQAMPKVVQGLAHLLPITYFVNSFRAIYLSGATFSDIYQDFIILSGFLGFNILLAWYTTSRIVRAEA